MKNIATLFGIVLLLFAVTGSSDHLSELKQNDCKRKHLVTAEPGTCLRLDAYRMLKIIEQVRENPLDNRKGKRFFDAIEPRVHCIKDTLIKKDSLCVPLRIYYPRRQCLSEVHPIIFYVHGGAFVYGSIEKYDMLARKIARSTNCIVTSVDYRLAPEHPFPCAIEDSHCALRWVVSNARELGGKEDAVCVMGSSAGGNIATVLTLKSKDIGYPGIACQVLYYPPTTFLQTEFPSRIYFLRDSLRSYFLTEELMMECRKKYLGNNKNIADRYLSPLEAKLGPDLPPALIITAQCDPLRDEGRLYAEKLQEAGTYVEYKEYPGQIHGFLSFYMLLNDGKKSLKQTREFIYRQIDLSN